MARWRLIVDPGLKGTENMAVDEAVLRAADSAPGAVPTLRVYGWSEPTVSIGYLQKAAVLLSSGLPVVRRITGGRAVLHDRELTYSIVAGTEDEPFAGGITGAYSFISRCIIEALKEAGVEAGFARATGNPGGKDACFHTPSRYEVLVDGRKLVGSSQRRFKNSFLQHGSILLGIDKGMNSLVFGPEVVGRMASLSEFSSMGETEFRDSFVRAMARGLGAEFTVSVLSEKEALLKEELQRTRYENAGWNISGAAGPGEREEASAPA